MSIPTWDTNKASAVNRDKLELAVHKLKFESLSRLRWLNDRAEVGFYGDAAEALLVCHAAIPWNRHIKLPTLDELDGLKHTKEQLQAWGVKTWPPPPFYKIWIERLIKQRKLK